MIASQLSDLFAGLGRGIPSLPGARCIGSAELFDPHERDSAETFDEWQYRRDAAVRTCRQCPARQPCEEWVAGLTPAQRPIGIVAGRLIYRPGPRTKAAV